MLNFDPTILTPCLLPTDGVVTSEILYFHGESSQRETKFVKSGENMNKSVPNKMFKQLQNQSTHTTSRQKKKWICNYCDEAGHIKSCCFKFLVDRKLQKVNKLSHVIQEWRVKKKVCFVAYNYAKSMQEKSCILKVIVYAI